MKLTEGHRVTEPRFCLSADSDGNEMKAVATGQCIGRMSVVMLWEVSEREN